VKAGRVLRTADRHRQTTRVTAHRFQVRHDRNTRRLPIEGQHREELAPAYVLISEAQHDQVWANPLDLRVRVADWFDEHDSVVDGFEHRVHIGHSVAVTLFRAIW
jgi:hypothetical protein